MPLRDPEPGPTPPDHHEGSAEMNRKLKRCLFLVIGGMVRAMFAGNYDEQLARQLFTSLAASKSILDTEGRGKSSVPEDASTLTAVFQSCFEIDSKAKMDFPIFCTICKRAISLELTITRQFETQRVVEPLHVNPIEVLGSRSASVAQTEFFCERFILERRNIALKAVKKYRTLFQSLSVDNGPWSTPEHTPRPHFRLENSIFKGFVRLRTKPNLEFDDHRAASLTRDVGSYEDAQNIYQKELSKMKLQEFKGDFALLQFADEDVPDEVRLAEGTCRLTCTAQLVTQTEVFSGTMSLYHIELFFSSSDRVLRIPLALISKIYFRRYLLADSAIEIFTTSSKAYFINFDGEQRQVFLNALLLQKPPALKFCQRKPEEIKRLAAHATVKWQQGRLSNMSYLLKLNCLSGRSYNDLSQYPVMPWILSDYTSETIDLSDPSVYRDLSKPVGALNEERLQDLQARLVDAFDDSTRYLYGSMYSSAAVVIGFLIRLEPFTSLHIKLQNGRFDHADRLFESISEAWDSVRTMAMDFRELIPEFFTFPDFLSNEDRFDLGLLSDKRPVDHVLLPPWAKSPREFVELNRQALESPYVSLHLHEWVDLIFGPHSRAPLYEEANNIFHPFFYETALKGDPRSLPIVREYAACFGAIPGQLFEELPLARSAPRDPLPPLPQSRQLLALNQPLLALTAEHGILFAVDERLNFSLVQGSEVIRGRLLFPQPPDLPANPIVALSRRFAIASFPWSSAFSVFVPKGGSCQSLASRVSHSRPITCLAICGRAMVSASQDCTLRLWRLEPEPAQVRLLAKHAQPIAFVRTSERLQQAISVSRDGFVLAMSLRTGRYLRGFRLPLSYPSDVAVSEIGFVAVCFNGPDSHIVIVLDQNLRFVARRGFDGCVQCWAALEYAGSDHLVVALRGGGMKLVRLPLLGDVKCDIEPPFTPALIACARGECFIASPEGAVWSFPIRAKIT